MAFFSEEELKKLPPSEYWHSLLSVGENLAIFLEGIMLFMLCCFKSAELIQAIQNPVIWWITFSLLLAISLGLVIFLITVQSVLFYEFVNALDTETKRDDYAKGLLVSIITILIIFADIKGSKQFLNKYNAYVPNISSVDTDSRVKLNKFDREKIEQERVNKDKSLICTKCKEIQADYDLKISKQRSNLRKNENEAKWKKVENDKIRSIVNSLEAQKSSAIAIAESKFIEEKNKVLATFDSRLFSLDTLQVAVKSSIDSSNNIEQGKVTEKEKENERNSGGLTILTQVILFGCRFRKVKIFKKRGLSYKSIGKFMKSSDILLIPINYISMRFNSFIEKKQVNLSVSYANEINSLNTYKESKVQDNEITRHFVENKIQDFESAKAAMLVIGYAKNETPVEIEDEKILKKDEQNIDNTSEKDIILAYISDCELGIMSLNEVDNLKEIETLKNIISDCEIAILSL
jgi:hypothetical protein